MEFKLFNKKVSIKDSKKELENRSFGYPEDYNPLVGSIKLTSYSSFSQQYAMKLSAMNRAVKLVAGSLASMPINVYQYQNNSDFKTIDYQHPLYDILNVAPNIYQNKYNFIFQLIQNKFLKGQAMVLIKRDVKQNIIELQHLEPNNYAALIENGKKLIVNKLNTKEVYDDSDVLHIYDYSIDGLNGVSIVNQAGDSLDITYNAEQHALNWFKSGGNAAGILTPKTGVNVTETKAKAAKEKFINALNAEVGGESNSIIVLDSGLDYQQISSNPAETQLLESRIHQVIEVARFTGVPPSLLFDQNGKYSTTEQQQLDYLNNCITPLCELIEAEMLKKLFTKPEWQYREIRFNTENLLRADLATRSNYYKTLIDIGHTVNEIRQKTGAEFPVIGGNRAFISTNLQPLDNLIAEQNKNQIDNKIK